MNLATVARRVADEGPFPWDPDRWTGTEDALGPGRRPPVAIFPVGQVVATLTVLDAHVLLGVASALAVAGACAWGGYALGRRRGLDTTPGTRAAPGEPGSNETADARTGASQRGDPRRIPGPTTRVSPPPVEAVRESNGHADTGRGGDSPPTPGDHKR